MHSIVCPVYSCLGASVLQCAPVLACRCLCAYACVLEWTRVDPPAVARAPAAFKDGAAAATDAKVRVGALRLPRRGARALSHTHSLISLAHNLPATQSLTLPYPFDPRLAFQPCPSF
eukprot:5813717-Pleurochrysis_carterae.AAC.3